MPHDPEGGQFVGDFVYLVRGDGDEQVVRIREFYRMGAPQLRTSGGVPVTDELLERLAREAEAGYDLDQMQPRARRQRVDPPGEEGL